MGSRSANPAPVAAKTDEERGMSRIPGNPSNRFWWYLIPGLLVLLWIIIVPAIWNIYLSFTNYRGIRPPRWIGIDNWSRLIRDATFWASFRNSIWMIVAMVVIPILIGLILASLVFDVVQKRFGAKTASTMRAVYYFPQLLPISVAALVMGWIFRPENGALNAILKGLGLGRFQHNWLGSPDTALIFLMIIMIWIQLGYPLVIFMSGLQRVDPELYEAASLDGANWWQRFKVITLPAIKPEIFVVALTCTIAALKVFAPVYMLTKGGPGDSTIVPSYYSYTQFFQSQQVGYGAAISTALTIVIIVISVVFTNVQQRVEQEDEE
ncbi:sugar ABC transporter permease [Bifidobacterium sp. B4081]|uniref:carbohydrate ABC transporter permease n=1 Tax=Bifidobacterium TaxID=1678 RepID=UPI000467E54B|nr:MULTISPECIES: sugar ABC transporter permease [Bifidobacterium]MCX8644231.1 sugar ABC transporter permease [Bifidobacterium sp. B4077]MCX8645319.1 sugar ABC transporter permease [Bifidobacterium sp. B4081]MCX8646945.1 sugar ABC transporter permease [Bifidobacterium sp. B4107]MCX8651130.1 sugar ABC transporter permease [Bifidobacterium sp. B4111]MCX8657560.1 sugar ABC transporter permease [Bifidobacterium sp. B4114]